MVKRAVLVIRHGIRAPLADEIPAGTRVSAPWPLWPVVRAGILSHAIAAPIALAGAGRDDQAAAPARMRGHALQCRPVFEASAGPACRTDGNDDRRKPVRDRGRYDGIAVTVDPLRITPPGISSVSE